MQKSELSHGGPTTAAVAGAYLIAVAVAAVTIPALLAWNVPPSATFFNQAAAVIGWGLVVGLVAAVVHTSNASSRSPSGTPPRSGKGDRSSKDNSKNNSKDKGNGITASMLDDPADMNSAGSGLIAILAALGIMALAAAASSVFGALPASLSLSSIGMIVVAIVVVIAGAGARRLGLAEPVFKALCIALVVAGLVSMLVACVQVFLPHLADGTLVARADPGRAAGNLRQPNHLASLVMWSAVAAVWLAESGAVKRIIGVILVALFVFTLALSASRTGVLECVALALWGALDRRLSRTTRVLLVLTPVIYVACWFGLAQWAKAESTVFVGAERLKQADVSSSRFAIWGNAIGLIRQQPWLGTGFGEFNLAWTLTPFPGRPGEFFDDPHNLLLHLATELGIPLALLVTALLCRALWSVFLNSRKGTPALQSATRAMFVMVVIIAIHSQLEYPLWYAYFLLPAALMLGLGLGVPPAQARSGSAPGAMWLDKALAIASACIVIGGVASVIDYYRVVVIFSPTADASPLMDRIERGSHSVLFSHHADYAAATTEQSPPADLGSFGGSTHYLLDTRLMMAWADTYARAGDLQRARYIAARLREFNNPEAAAYFAPCSGARPTAGPAAPSAPGRVTKTLPDGQLPYQCTAPTQPLTWRDFR